MRAVEDALGVLIGIIDGTDDQATVTLIGPLAQVVLAREVIPALAVGARSILTRLIKSDWSFSSGRCGQSIVFLFSRLLCWSSVRRRVERLDDGPNGPTNGFNFGVC